MLKGLINTPIPSGWSPASIRDLIQLLQELGAGGLGDIPAAWRGLAADIGGANCFYPAGFPSNFNSTTVPTVGELVALPFYSGRGGVVSALGANVVTGAATAVFRMGVYANDYTASPRPGALLLDGGADLDGSATAFKQHTGLSLTMDPATLYWLAVIFGLAAPTMTGCSGDTPIYGFSTAVSAQFGVKKTGQGYGALPNPFPASMAVTASSQVETFALFSSLNALPSPAVVPAWNPTQAGV